MGCFVVNLCYLSASVIFLFYVVSNLESHDSLLIRNKQIFAALAVQSLRVVEADNSKCSNHRESAQRYYEIEVRTSDKWFQSYVDSYARSTPRGNFMFSCVTLLLTYLCD